MNCTHCGEVLTGEIKFCPACGTPVPQVPEKTTEECEAALESAAVPPEKTTEEYEAELRSAVVEAAPKEAPKKKRRFRIPIWPFVTILLLFGIYRIASGMFSQVTQVTPTLQGASSCEELAEIYLDALAEAEVAGRLEALVACALPAEEGEELWPITDSCKAPVGKTALSVALGKIQFSDLTANASDAAALEEFCGYPVEEVLQVPVTAFYTDGSSVDFTMELVQLEVGYFLLAVK